MNWWLDDNEPYPGPEPLPTITVDATSGNTPYVGASVRGPDGSIIGTVSAFSLNLTDPSQSTLSFR